MKIYRTILPALSAVALGFGIPATAVAQNRNNLPGREAGAARSDPPAAESPSSTSSVSSSVAAMHSKNLQRATDDYEVRGFKAFKGREIKVGDERVGKIHDFIVDATTGRITHAIASSRGLLGFGDTLRLLPIGRLELRGETFSTKLDRNRFDTLPKISESHLKAGRIPATNNGALVSQFSDQKIRAGAAEMGEIDDVALDFTRGVAFVVVEVNGEFAGTEGHFLVPFERLQMVGGDVNSITATIDRGDFAHVQPEAAQMSGNPAQPNPENQSLSPTGRADPGS